MIEMRVSREKLADLPPTACQIETPGWRVEYQPDSFVFNGSDDKTVVVEGDIYYCLDKSGKYIHAASSGDVRGLLKRVYDSVGEEGFAENVEGLYQAAFIDKQKDSISITGDAFSRSDLYYCSDGKYPVVSTEIEDIVSQLQSVSYDPAVISCLLILGYPPLKHTPYRGIRRLAVGERLCLQDSKIELVKPQVKACPIVEMDETYLDRYAEIFENAILSRASQSENWVLLSSGWDSTTVLGVLRKYFDIPKVRAVITAVKLRDGRYFNPYEVEKAARIAEYYGVPAEISMIDWSDSQTLKLWDEHVQLTHSKYICEQAFIYLAMANTVREKADADAAVFGGNYSDALHNFGFSQYISLPYLSQEFRVYGDKIKTYLYSPSFLQKVDDNAFEDDFAYRLFKWHSPGAEFTDVAALPQDQRLFRYLLSFVMSGSRLPFARFATEPFFSLQAEENLSRWLYDNYFKDAVENMDGSNMYFWLSWLYQHFHLQGQEMRTITRAIRGAGRRPCFPFYDLDMVKFLQTMPENWGRGLEWRPTKYPMRHYACEGIRVPHEIIESGLHSYLTDSDAGRTFDYRSEIINNSVLTPEMRNLRESSNLDGLFDRDYFNNDVLSEMLQNGESQAGSLMLLRLLVLLSAGLQTGQENITGLELIKK